MKKQTLNEEFKRMQKLAGLITENNNYPNDELPYELGEPHPSAVYPAGGAWHTLSTGTSIDIGEDPYHGQYPMLTIEEHEEVIELLNNYIEQYEENFGGTEYYNKDVVDLAKYIVQQHEKKISSLMMNENISRISKSDFKNMIREMVLAEAKKDEKEEEDVEIEDTETVDTEEMPTEETPQGNPDDILDSLKTALDGAKALGDEKLVDQIGNTITFYTRVHIVGQETDMN